jgi:hypothetical protein
LHVTPDSSVLELVNGDDVHMLLAATATGSTATATFDRAMHFGEAIETRRYHAIRRGTVQKADGTEHPAAVVTWSCPDQQATGYAYVMQWGARGLEDGVALAETGRCLGSDEPMLDDH